MSKLSSEELAEQKHALSLLSPQEREAMGVDDDDADILKTVAGNETEDDQEDDADEAADKGKAKADPKAKESDEDGEDDDEEGEDEEGEGEDEDDGKGKPDAAAEAAAAEAAKAAEAAAAAAVIVEPIVLDLAPIEDGYRAKLTELNEVKASQFQKLMDGEITAADYAKIEADYHAARDDARDDRQARIEWFREVNGFQNTVLKSDGINYAADAKANAKLDTWLQALAKDPDNATKDGMWFLTEAHKLVKLQLGIADKTTEQQAPQNKVEKNVVKKSGRAPDLTKIPPTLGGLPAAAETESDDGEFAHLDRLSGMEYERALSRLSPEQKARYEQD